MADLSFTFDPSDLGSKAAAASAKASAASVAAADGSNALSKITNRSGTWDKASGASSVAHVASAKASDASSAVAARSATWDKASAASSLAAINSNALSALDAIVIKSEPGAGSRAVHEIIYTAASSLKFVYSSNAAE